MTAEERWNKMKALNRRIWVDALIILQQDGDYDGLPTKRELDGKFSDLPLELRQMLQLADYPVVMKLAKDYVRVLGAPWDVVYQPYWNRFEK